VNALNIARDASAPRTARAAGQARHCVMSSRRRGERWGGAGWQGAERPARSTDWCAQRQLIDLLPLDSRFSGAARQSWQQHSLYRVAPIVVKHGHPVALRLFVSTRSPWTVRTDRPDTKGVCVSCPFVRRTLSTDGATDLSGERVTKQDFPGQ
jgi:hypothetical protein